MAPLTSTLPSSSLSHRATSQSGSSQSGIRESAPRPTAPTAAIRSRNERVERYRSLVRPIARHYQQRCSEPLEDLIQVGLLGLLRAAELYRPATSTPFEAFARPHIRGAMLHYLRDLALPIRLPRRLDEQRQQLARLRAEWLARHHRPATDSELRLALGVDGPGWERLLAAEHLVKVQSLEAWELDERNAGSLHPLECEHSLGCSGHADGRGSVSCPEPSANGSDAPEPASLLALLEEPLRVVVERVILRGWSYRRTATALHVSPMTVQRRLSRGLELLRRSLLSPQLPLHPAASAVPGC